MLTNILNLLGILPFPILPIHCVWGEVWQFESRKKPLWLPGFGFQKPKSLRERHRQSIQKSQEGRGRLLSEEKKVTFGWDQREKKGGRDVRAERWVGSSAPCRMRNTAPVTSSYILSSQVCWFLTSHNYIQLCTPNHEHSSFPQLPHWCYCS